MIRIQHQFPVPQHKVHALTESKVDQSAADQNWAWSSSGADCTVSTSLRKEYTTSFSNNGFLSEFIN